MYSFRKTNLKDHAEVHNDSRKEPRPWKNDLVSQRSQEIWAKRSTKASLVDVINIQTNDAQGYRDASVSLDKI